LRLVTAIPAQDDRGAVPPAAILAALRRHGWLAPNAAATGARLTGGVSSEIWRIDLPGGPICAKQALAKLNVAAEWYAPVARNRYEARWLQAAGAAAPRVLGSDDAGGVLLMEYLPPERYPLWKAELLAGRADPGFAAAVGGALGRIHAASAATPAETAARFPTDAIFHAIRLEPYLLATARAHPDRAAALLGLAETTAATHRALVHGDVSPKNILVGPDGPLFLDAECAWWGDPAFDLAFCLNHLLLKCLRVPRAAPAMLGCFDALATAHRACIAWEEPATLEERAAHLLPGLMLARVDGKSPVEYLTEAAEKASVRRVARALLAAPVARLGEVRAAWVAELRRRGVPA